MDVRKILADLRREKAQVENAIRALEGLGGKRRGRPPAWMRDKPRGAPRSKKGEGETPKK